MFPPTWRLPCRCENEVRQYLQLPALSLRVITESLFHRMMDFSAILQILLCFTCGFVVLGCIARIIHEASTAAADPGMSTALRSGGFLDVPLSTTAESSRRAPCIHARLRRLATNLHE